MSTNGQTGTVTSLHVDGMSVDDLVAAKVLPRTRPGSSGHRYWASAPRHANSTHRDIMEVSFASARLLNHISLKVSRFPHTLTAEWLDENGRWQPLTYSPAPEPVTAPIRRLRRREPVSLSVSDSSPSVIREVPTGNPFHSGKSHWQSESWKVAPVRTSKVRLIVVRNSIGDGPTDTSRRPVAYPIAIADLTFGYRVLSRHDMPSYDSGVWAASSDILGSRVGYSTYDQPATKAVDGSTSTYWRSEPQPFSYAVTGFHMDMRDPNGEAQVVDRFWIDPITSGVLCNVYYSNDIDHEYFRGLSTPIDPNHETRVGVPTLVTTGAASTPLAIEMDPNETTGVEVSQPFVRADYSKAWWVGLDAQTLVPATDTGTHPILSMGSTSIEQSDGAIKVTTSNGEQAVLMLDPSLHLMRARFALTVSYHPADATSPKNRIRIAYRLLGHAPEVVTYDLLSALDPTSGPIGVGLPPSGSSADGCALSIRGLVVKAEALTDENRDWFFEEGETFIGDPLTPYDDRGTHFNSLLRMHPDFVTADNVFGVVGGANDPFDLMTWTPIAGDYVLRQGYMAVPPTKAAFWKFEMTGLLPEVYENFLTMDRDVLIFPPDVVSDYEAASGAADDNSSPSGVDTTASASTYVQYSDVRDAIDRSQVGISFQQDSDATKVLVVKDPVQAQRVATSGWVWTYQPWHSGSRAPRFSAEQVHRYDALRIRHSTKVAYFAGIREITPMRVDYAFPDDNPEYVEHFRDTAFIDLDETTGVEFVDDGGVRNIASAGQISSTGLRSYRNVRGIQFATSESDMIQVLEDPDFNAVTMGRWETYGDAKVTRLGPANVIINRGWDTNTYGELEQPPYGTYAALEEDTYGELEGLNPQGTSDGGIISTHYLPFGSGEVMARVHISAPADLTVPVVVELVSSETDEVWASSQRLLKAGESVVLSVKAAGSGTMQARSYGDLEELVTPPTQYEELEDYSYAELESAEGQASSLYVRVAQHGASTDTFRVHRIALYDSPVAWYFSNDDGASYWQAVSVRNDPHSVLSFPEFFDTNDDEMGRTLRWKAKIFKAGATISALHIRPWYGVRGRTVDRAHGLEVLGPNRNLRDLLPATHQHPMWQEVFNPIEHTYVSAPTTWRNLMTNPSAEGPVSNSEWTPEGGRVRPAIGATGTGFRSFEFTAGEDD